MGGSVCACLPGIEEGVARGPGLCLRALQYVRPQLRAPEAPTLDDTTVLELTVSTVHRRPPVIRTDVSDRPPISHTTDSSPVDSPPGHAL